MAKEISEGYFDRHEVLFSDAREQLTSARESAELLIAGYNCFAEDNGKESISLDSDDVRPSRSVEQRLTEWVIPARFTPAASALNVKLALPAGTNLNSRFTPLIPDLSR